MNRRTFLEAVLAAVAFVVSGGHVFGSRVAKLCAKLKPRPPAVKLPPLPQWNKLTDDIDWAESRLRSQDFERSLLPRDLIFPRSGQVWEAVSDCRVIAPFVV